MIEKTAKSKEVSNYIRDYLEDHPFKNEVTLQEMSREPWLYDSDFKLFTEGQRRAKLLNIDIPKLMNNDFTNFQEKGNILRDLREVIRKSYYTSNESFYKNLSVNEKIDYFVFENKYLSNKPKGLKEIYKNKYFSIYK